MSINYEEWLANDNHRIVLIDMVSHNGTGYGLETFSSYPYVMPIGDTYTNLLGNVVSNVGYDDIISNVPNIVSGITEDTAVGQIELINSDGEYDYLLDSSITFAGHPVQVSIGESSWVRNDFLAILEGIIETISSPTQNKIVIHIRDKKEILNVHLQPNLIDTTFFSSFMDAVVGTFTGSITNSSGSQTWNRSLAVLPEATKNTQIPICLGKCFNIEPVLIDEYNHVYIMHEGPIVSVDQVRANGIILTAGVDYEVYLPIGSIRLLIHNNSSQITCDVTGQNGRSSKVTGTPASLTIHSAAYLIEWILLEKTSLLFSDISQDTFPPTGTNAFDNVSELGFYSTSDITVLEAVTKIINSVGGYLRFTKPPVEAEIIKFIDPALETPDLYLVADDIIREGFYISSIEQPKKSLTIGYKKNWTVQDSSGLAGMILDTDFTNLGLLNSYINEFSKLSNVTGISAVQFPLAEDQDIIESLIYNESDALTELNRRIVLRATKRYIYKIDSIATPFLYNIGDIVNITHSRYDFSLGKNALIIRMEESPFDKRVSMEVWL